MKGIFNTMKYEAAGLAIAKMQYLDNSIDFPTTKVTKGEIDPSIFYPAYAGETDNNEKNAIGMYTTMAEKFIEYNDLFNGIAISEMIGHSNKLLELINDLGGSTADIEYNNAGLNANIKAATTARKALELGVQGEVNTIALYEDILVKLADYPDSESKQYCVDLVKKIIADEVLHQKLFQEALDNLPKETAKEATLRHLTSHIK